MKSCLKKLTTRHLNICLVSREYPLETGWGGIGTYTYHLAHGLADKGHKVYVICQGLNGEREYKDNNVHICRISHPEVFTYKGKLREFALRLEYSKGVHQKICELAKYHPIDIIEGPNLSAELFTQSFLRKAPIVTRLHTHYGEVIQFCDWPMTFDRQISCWLEDAVISRSDLVTCSSRAHAELIASEAGINPDKIKIIPLGVPLPELNHKPKSEFDSAIILFVGRLEKRKGVHILIKAMPYILEEIPQAKFLIIGKDTLLNVHSSLFNGSQDISFKSLILKDLPEQYLSHVSFLGYVEPKDLDFYFRICDLFVAPSLYESCGFIYLEAMSYAKPVIGCGVGGIPEVIQDGVTGLLVPPEDPESLAWAIATLLKDKDRRLEMGKMARKHIETNFTREHMVENTIKAYSEII